MNRNVLLPSGKYLWLIHTSGCPRNKAKPEIFLIGTSLSEPHINELNVRNLYIIIIYILQARRQDL